MKVYFIRHGQTELNKKGIPMGRIDEPLNEEGLEEARKIGKEISPDFSLIYSSDLIRCKQTAGILNEKLNVPVIYDSRLRERDFGTLSGKSFSQMDPSGNLSKIDYEQKYDYRPYGGESAEDVKKRLFDFLKEITSREVNKKILVVTHGGIIRLLHNMLEGKVHEEIHNNSVHEFDFTV